MPRRKSKRRLNLNVYYVVEIDNWDWGYNFGLDESRYRDEPYREFRHLRLTGKLLRPRNVKADAVEVTLMPDAKLKEESRKRDEPRSVGALISSRGQLQVLLPFPSDALEPVLQTLIANKLRYVTINGSPLHYRQGLVKSFSLDSNYDPAELPPEPE